MSETVKQNETLPWLKDQKPDLNDLADSSAEAIENAADAVSHAVGDVADALVSITHTEVQHKPKAGMPQFDTDWYPSQLFWLFICFTLLYLFMSRSIIPRIREVLESRQHRIDADLEFARSMQQESETIKHDYEASISSAQSRVRDLIQQAQEKSEATAVNAHKELDTDILALHEKADKEIDTKLKEIESESLPVVEELASLLVEKIMLKKPDNDQVKRAVKAEMSSFSLKKSA